MRLTYPHVMSTAAVFLALGGTGYAASRISGRDIADRSIPGRKLKLRSVGPPELNARPHVQVRYALTDGIPGNPVESVTAYCAPGEVAIGGGGGSDDGRSYVLSSRPAVRFITRDREGFNDRDEYPELYNESSNGDLGAGENGRSGWLFEVVKGTSDSTRLHAYAVCVRAKRLPAVEAKRPPVSY